MSLLSNIQKNMNQCALPLYRQSDREVLGVAILWLLFGEYQKQRDPQARHEGKEGWCEHNNRIPKGRCQKTGKWSNKSLCQEINRTQQSTIYALFNSWIEDRALKLYRKKSIAFWNYLFLAWFPLSSYSDIYHNYGTLKSFDRAAPGKCSGQHRTLTTVQIWCRYWSGNRPVQSRWHRWNSTRSRAFYMRSNQPNTFPK